MGTINQISANNHIAAASTVKNDGDNNLYKEKLVFSPSELGLNGKRPATVVLTEKQVETKIFEKYGFDVRNKVQTAMLKLRFDTKNNPASEINWEKGQFVARLNSNGKYEITLGLRERTLEALQGRLINAPSVSNSGSANPNDAISSRTGYDAARIKKNQIQNLPKPDLSGLTPEQQELVLDLTQVGLSVVGIFDPTGIADGADAAISLKRGDYWEARAFSALGIIPYLGDIAKIGKLPKLLKTIEKVVDVAKQSPAFAKVVEPLLKGLKGALDRLPIDKLPNWAKEPIQSMKNKIDEFFSAAKKLDKTEPSLPPDPNRVPEGNPKKTNPNDKDPVNIRATQRENESAKTLAEHGYKIKQLPDSTKGKVQGIKNPDFEIEGKVFDNYAPGTSNARNIAGTLEKKLGETQADRFVLNLDDSKVSIADLRKQLQDYPIANLKEIIIVKGGKVIPFYPF